MNGSRLMRFLSAKTRLGAFFLLLLASVIPVCAAESAAVPDKDVFDRIWGAARLYDDKESSVVQAFSLIGRYHGQFWSVSADQGAADDWENRRFYLGAEATLFRRFTVQLQIKISEDFDPVYDGFYQAFVRWSPGEAFSLSAGRLDFLFVGLERTVSSTRIATFERGQLANQIWPGEAVGAVAQGKSGDVSFRAGVFSGSIDQEFTTFAGGVAVAAWA